MDTTQKNREERSGQAGKPAHPRQAREETRPRRSAPEENRPRKASQEENRSRQAVREDNRPRPTPREEARPRKAPEETRPRQATRESARGEEKKPRRRQNPTATSRRRENPGPQDVPDRKRAYGNSKPKKKSALQQAAESMGKLQRQVKEDPRNRARQAQRQRRRQQAKKQFDAPAVIYTQPVPFNRDRLLIQLTTVAAVVLAVILGLSVFFKVETITVSGAEVYSNWAVREASGISEGDNLLTFSKIRAAGQIMAKLPYVEKVRIGIKLPDTVNIMVKEASVVYAIRDSEGSWWLMDSEGRVIEQTNNAVAVTRTQVLGVTLDSPNPGSRGVATETAQAETDEEGHVIPVTTTGALRLTAALKILNALEANDIVGEAASVDVSNIEEIILWYGSRYQVNLGDSSQLETKVAWMNDAILQLSDYQTGELDISFTIWPDRVVYTPFS